MEKDNSITSILIVDDEASLRNTFRIFLSRAGYENVQAVASFDEAISAVNSQTFDLIICDIVLENHSGIDLLQTFNEMGVTCPVVIVTGFPHVETASEAVRLGAFDYLAKPVEKETLLKTARLALRQYRLELEKNKYRTMLETIFKSVSDTIISVDKDLTIVEINHIASTLCSAEDQKLVSGAKLDNCLRGTDLSVLSTITKNVLTTGVDIPDTRLECSLTGVKKLLSICVSPLKNALNDTQPPTGAVLVLRDITYKREEEQKSSNTFHKLIGTSPVMQELFTLIKSIGKVDTSVLVTGASGTGKELVADALHRESKRKNKPFIKFDCTAIADNLLESELFGHKKGAFTGATEDRKGRIFQANGGTLFLDEIGDISPMMQLRLLRFLQEKTYYPVGSDKEVQVDVRVVAATNANLKKKVANGSFREDLYFRLLIIDIALPLLCDRNGDIPLLANHFIKRFSAQMKKNITGISDQAMTILSNFSWPGNVRQLEHVIERACVLCPGTTISLSQLPKDLTATDTEHQNKAKPSILDHFISESQPYSIDQDQSFQTPSFSEVKSNIIHALKKAGGNKAKAARLLGIDRSTLYRKIHELHINLHEIEQ